jgi:hypothetical protein
MHQQLASMGVDELAERFGVSGSGLSDQICSHRAILVSRLPRASCAVSYEF